MLKRAHRVWAVGLALACAVAATTGLSARDARADGLGDSLGFNPRWDWKMFETEHFRLYFPKELDAHARLAARHLEDAHRLLSKRLRWSPALKTQIVVIDNEDAANGLTATIARFGIVLRITPPDNWFSTYYYDDWMQLLCYHEYTHFINMDATTGVYGFLRVLFGDLLLPNSFWPSWMLEGLAVYEETRLTHGGRGRSPFYDMILRAAVEGGKLNTSDFVTLDKINGENPYYPGGETPYLFGYEMMNQVSSKTRESNLGEMSLRSAGRIPYFINGNLENITGRDWYSFWDEWANDTRAHAEKQLATIRSRPVTSFERITDSKYSVLGAAVSPDGKLIAYTEDSLDNRAGLFIRGLQTGKARRIEDKSLGVSMAFTPDSRFLVSSQARRENTYYLWSDLRAHDLVENKEYWISDSLRARDPDISRDGQHIVFTLTEDATTGLATAPLLLENGRLKLGPVTRVYWPKTYGLVSTPKFSPSGEQIVFSFHRNNKPSEEIMSIAANGAGSEPTTLVSNGRYNRFPAYDGQGRLHFVSDLSGTDNLFRYEGGHAVQVTNMTTAVWLPTFGKSTAYASVLSYQGWELAKISVSENAIPTPQVTISDHPAPEVDREADALAAKPAPAIEATRDYSIFPSIWPRQWVPILGASTSFYVGGSVLGYDAADRHRYLFGLVYDGEIRKADWLATYTNRSFGPTLTLLADETFSYPFTNNTIERDLDVSAAISYPIRWTYSSLTPSLEAKVEQTAYQFPATATTAPRDRHFTDNSFTARGLYSDAESSRLAIAAEAGRTIEAGARVYTSPYRGDAVVKSLYNHTEYVDLWRHVVAQAQLRGALSSRKQASLSDSNVEIAGRSRNLISEFTADSFDRFRLRGYPRVTIQTQAAVLPSLDIKFPLANIFRGWGTNPVFLDNLSGFVFSEGAYFPNDTPGYDWLTSVGGGVRLTTEVFLHIPLIFSTEYHAGLTTGAGGTNELFFKLGLGAIGF